MAKAMQIPDPRSRSLVPILCSPVPVHLCAVPFVASVAVPFFKFNSLLDPRLRPFLDSSLDSFLLISQLSFHHLHFKFFDLQLLVDSLDLLNSSHVARPQFKLSVKDFMNFETWSQMHCFDLKRREME